MNKSIALLSLSLIWLVGCNDKDKSVSAPAPENSSVAATDNKAEADTLWLTDFESAKAASKESGKPIFALFTGSDWCCWCVALHKEVLKTEAFKAYASKKLVLFEADFPRNKKISKEVQKQNQELAEKYGVQGFPTVLILDAEGKKLSETGYQAGGGEKYVEHLKKLLK